MFKRSASGPVRRGRQNSPRAVTRGPAARDTTSLGNSAAARLAAGASAPRGTVDPQLLGVLAGRPALQRTIVVKNGPTYGTAALLPPALAGNARLTAAANHADPHLVRSAGDLTRIATGAAGVQMLTPHRHLVGEHHNASPLETLSRDWKWGAPLLSEALNASPSVRSATTEELRTSDPLFAYNPHLGARALENTHATILPTLAMLVHELGRLHTAVLDNIREHAAAVAGNRAMNDAVKAQLDDDLAQVRRWGSEAEDALQDYRRAATATTVAPTLQPLATAMTHRWAALFAGITAASKSPWNILPEHWDAQFGAKLTTFDTTVTTLRADVTFVAREISAVMKAEDPTVTAVADNAMATLGGATTLDDTSDAREHFMAINLNAASVPAIASLGQAHVRRMSVGNPIVNGLYHDSYADFVNAIT